MGVWLCHPVTIWPSLQGVPRLHPIAGSGFSSPVTPKGIQQFKKMGGFFFRMMENIGFNLLAQIGKFLTESKDSEEKVKRKNNNKKKFY